MNVWLVTIGEPVPVQGGPRDRLHRAGYLANFLVDHGHNVTWWTSTFDHFHKRHLFKHDTKILLNGRFCIKLLHGSGYKRNVSLARILDHKQIAFKFARSALNGSPPDIILCSLPTLELSVAAVHYGKINSVPVVIDIRDLWPDVFLDVCPKPFQPLAQLILYPMRRNARKACAGATAITGPTKAYVNWGLMQGQREHSPNDISFSFGYPRMIASERNIRKGLAYWKLKGLSTNGSDTIICFFGTIGRQFDLDTVINAAKLLLNDMISIRLVLCGAGDKLEYYKNISKNMSNILFPGWVGPSEIQALMEISSIGLAPYRETKNFLFNIPNKVAEYLSGGLPIALSLDKGVLSDLIYEKNCGFSYAGNHIELTKLLKDLIVCPERMKTLSNNAKRVFEDMFDADKVYGEMMNYLQELAIKYKKTTINKNIAI